MTKTQKLEVGLALNHIANTLDTFNYQKAKTWLSNIERICLDDKIEIDGKFYKAENPVLKSVSNTGEVIVGGFKEV